MCLLSRRAAKLFDLCKCIKGRQEDGNRVAACKCRFGVCWWCSVAGGGVVEFALVQEEKPVVKSSGPFA